MPLKVGVQKDLNKTPKIFTIKRKVDKIHCIKNKNLCSTTTKKSLKVKRQVIK